MLLLTLLLQVAIGEVFRPKPASATFTKYTGPTASEARPVPVLWGTGLVKGLNVLWYGDLQWSDITEVIKVGLVGTHKQIVAYSYYLGMHLGICMGTIDYIRSIRVGDKTAWQGAVSPSVNGTFFQTHCIEKSGQAFYTPNLKSASPNDLVATCTLFANDLQDVGGFANVGYKYLYQQTGGNMSAYHKISSLMIDGPSSAFAVDIKDYVPLPHPDPQDPACPLGLPCPAGENERVPASTWVFSGNIGTDPQFQAISVVASRWPKGIPNGNGYVTTGNDASPSTQMHKICYGATSYQGLRSMWLPATGNMPAPDMADKGKFFIASAGSRSAAGLDGPTGNDPATPAAYSYANTQYGTSTVWHKGDLVISNGKTWYRSVGFDCNPAEMIYEVITSDDDFIGIPTSKIDSTSFQLAAKALYDEGFGLTMQFDQKIKGRDLIAEILRHIDGIVYMDVGTGKFKLKLIRAGDTATQLIAAGKVFNEDNVIELVNFSRSAWDETTNEVKVIYTDSASNFQPKTISVQDLANISVQNDIITSEINYPGITSFYLANKVAYRDLRCVSFPIARINFKCDRRLYDIGPGDTFVFQWGALGIQQIVFRVTKRKESDLLDGSIEIEAAQDVFSFGTSAYTDIDPGGWNDPVGGVSDITIERLLAAPFFFTQDLVRVESMALAVKPTASTFRYNVYSKLASPSTLEYQAYYAQPATVPSGLLLYNYSKSAGLVAPLDSPQPTGSAAVDTQQWDLRSTTELVLYSQKDLQNVVRSNDNQIAAGYGLFLIDEEIIGVNWILGERGLGVHAIVGTGTGTLGYASLSTAPVTERWTITATSATNFTVVGSFSGATANATVGTTYDNGIITFLLTAGLTPFAVNDYFLIDVNTARNGTYVMYGSASPTVYGVWRGLLDTVPADHLANARAWYIGGGLGTCPTQFSPTESIKVKMTARSATAESLVSSATELSLTFDSESLRPYPPGNAKVNGFTWPTEITGQPTETWVERNRLTQATIIKQDAATVTPEAGTTYTMLIYRLSNEATSAPFLAGTGATSGPVLNYLNGPAKAACRVASTADVTISAPGAAIDGATMASGDRVLLKSQSTASQNGIYVWNGAASAMTRSADADTSAEVTSGLNVFVTAGTVNGGNLFILTTANPIILGTTGLTIVNLKTVTTVAGYTMARAFGDLTAGTVSQAYTVAQELADMGIGGGTRLSSHIKTLLYSTVGSLSSRQQQVRDFDCAGWDMLTDQYWDS